MGTKRRGNSTRDEEETANNSQYDDDSIQMIESRKMLEACKRAGGQAERLFRRKTVHFPACSRPGKWLAC